jgi:hypothetical protein
MKNMDNTMNALIEKMIQKAEGDKQPFVIVSYDVPSENTDNYNAEEKKNVRSKRMAIFNHCFLHSTQVQMSVYMFATEKVRVFMDKFDKEYAGTPYENQANLKLIGTVFMDTAISIMTNFIKTNMDKISEEVELADAQDHQKREAWGKAAGAKEQLMRDAYVTFSTTKKSELYQHSRILNSIREKISELKSINYTKTDEIELRFSKLEQSRSKVIYHMGI